MAYNSIDNDYKGNIEVQSFIHQAALDPHLDLDSLNQICDACNHFQISGLCTNLIRLPAAKKRLGKTQHTKLIAVIGFPFGATPWEIKKKEAEWAAEFGAEELDLVPNFFNLHQGFIDAFAEEIADIAEAGLPLRVILDSTRLSKEKLSLAVDASIDAGARGIQTGNGFGKITTNSNLIELIALVKNRCSIKAAGGIKSLSQVLDLINSGASSIGTSFGIDITKQSKQLQKEK